MEEVGTPAMIKTTLVAMTVMGCDCDARLCEYIGETPAQWSSVAECQAAMKTQIERRRDLDYPLISGVCQAVETPTAELALQVPPPVSSDTTVPIKPVPGRSGPAARVSMLYSAALDGGRIVFRKSEDGYLLVRSGVGQVAEGAVSLVRWTATSLMPGR